MTIRVDIKNCETKAVLYVEDHSGLRQLKPGEEGTFYVRKDNRIVLREDMRAKHPYSGDPAPDRRRTERRYTPPNE